MCSTLRVAREHTVHRCAALAPTPNACKFDIIHQPLARLQVVTYKWLARHFGLPASLAKQLLFAFVEAHRGKAAATYFLSGWTKETSGPQQQNGTAGAAGSHAESSGGDGDGGGGRRHVAQLVDAARLEARRAELATVTSLHVYSVQPAQPKVRMWRDQLHAISECQNGPARVGTGCIHEIAGSLEQQTPSCLSLAVPHEALLRCSCRTLCCPNASD